MAEIMSIRWNELPEHLREKILSRLPLRSVFRLRSVSRAWQSLLASKPFLRQWAFESPRNPSLILCAPQPQIPCLVYSFDLQSWQNLSLSFLEAKCGIYYKGSTSGLLMADIPSYNSFCNSFFTVCICNPLTRTFWKLPDIPCTVMARGIASGESEGFKVAVLGKSGQYSGNCSVQLQLYDSAVGFWKRLQADLPEPLAVRNAEMVFCAGKFFCMALKPPAILAFDVHAACKCTVLPMPCGSDTWPRLLTCGGSVMLAGAREEDDVVKDVIMWQYCCPTWLEVGRMSGPLCEQFGRGWCSRWFECVGVGENVCFRAHGSLEVLVYSTTRGSWTWLPTCPATYANCKYLHLKSLPFQPRPHTGV